MESILLARGLTDKELQAIRQLENACCRHEKLNMKLNWEMLDKRAADEINDFLYYDGDTLIGFIGLYSFGLGSKEVEITGMVHPDHRRKGVFKELFNAAKQECKARGTERILLITERSSDSGISFVKYIVSQYSFSEYRMKFSEINIPDFPKHGITLRKADYQDLQDIIHIDAVCFGLPEAKVEDSYLSDTNKSIYVAEIEGKSIGKIGILEEGKDGYIFGFGIMPEYRGLGYGREILSLSLQKLVSEQIHSALLEVAVKNENALSLYKSCGFKEITVYDYYEIVL